jgi:hypothetical protein
MRAGTELTRRHTHTCAAHLSPLAPLLPWTQTVTLYRDAGRLLPKEYTFKLQHVRGGGGDPAGGGAQRKTVAKLKLDLAQFCSSGDATPSVPQEVFLQLK